MSLIRPQGGRKLGKIIEVTDTGYGISSDETLRDNFNLDGKTLIYLLDYNGVIYGSSGPFTKESVERIFGVPGEESVTGR